MSESLDQIQCSFLGDTGTGRSSFLMTYFHGEFPGEYIPMVMEAYSRNVTVDGKDYQLTFNDTGSRGDYDLIRVRAYANQHIDVFAICFSVISEHSQKYIGEKWIPEIQENKPNVPFLFVGTKIDIRDDKQVLEKLGDHRKILSKKDGEKLAKEFGAKIYVEISSLTKTGFDEFINEIIRTAISSKQWKNSHKNKKKKNNCQIL